MRRYAPGVDSLLDGQKRVDDGLGVRLVVGGQRDLHTIARRENHGLADTGARFQILQRGRQSILAKSPALAHFHRRGLVAYPCQQQLHWFRSSAPSREWAAHVMAEKPSTVTVMMAA